MKLFDHENRLWECPQVPSVNTLRPRSPLFSFATEAEARTASYEPFDCPSIDNLNGLWSFRHFENPDQVEESLLADKIDTSGWDRIEVPGNWTRQGYDFPHYVNVQMPFGDTPPYVPKDNNPTGLYRRTFTLRKHAQRVVLHFGGIESCGFIYVNGIGVGMIKDSRTSCEFDITPVVRKGENTLAVLVLRYCDGTFLEDQDHWRMAGIHRDVYLEYTPNEYISDVFACTTLDDDLKTGVLKLRLDAAFAGTHDIPADWKFAVQLYDGKKAVWKQPDLLGFYDNNFQHAYASHTQPLAEKEYRIANVKPWSAETPNLYRITVCLLNGKGEVVQAVGHDIGFKSVKLEDGCLKINGQPVKFLGVNRHDFNQYAGKRVTMADLVADVTLMKSFNINAIRTCHYPNDERLVALCNRYGLYVISECNIETHAYCEHLTDDPLWLTPMMERMKRMVLIYKNNPCIHLWSMGNESGIGANFAALSAWTHRFDPSRLVHYAELNQHYPDELNWYNRANANLDLVDTVSPMYPDFKRVDQWLTKIAPQEKRPLIMCEYSHGMGNSHGALCDYFERFRKYVRFQGGYIWDWIDQGLHETDADGRQYWAYGGDYGDTPNDYDFIGNGMIGPDRTPHPACYEFRYLAKPFAIKPQPLPRQLFDFTNYNYFTTLDDYEFIWEVECDGQVLANGKIDRKEIAAIAPQQTKAIKIDWQEKTALDKAESCCEIFLNVIACYRKDTLWAKKGDICGHEQFRVDSAVILPNTPPCYDKRYETSVNERTHTYKCGGDVIKLNKEGSLDKWTVNHGSQELLACPITEQFLRGFIDNDGIRSTITTDTFRIGYTWLTKWDLLNLKRHVGVAPVSQASGEPPCYLVANTVEYTAANGGKIRVKRGASCNPDGSVLLAFSFEVPEELGDLPRLGISIVMPEGFENFTYFGKGPQECYIDRQAGAMIGLYKQTVTDQYFPYMMPQECGNHTAVRFAAVDNGAIGLLAVSIGNEIEASALHFTPEDFIEARHINELHPRKETILTLQVMQRGLGTGSCGEDTRDQYRIRPGRYNLSLRLFPFAVGEDLMAIANSCR